jgi:hypothetical protein
VKLLLTTPDALIDKNGDFFPGILKILTDFNADKNQGIVVVSGSGKGLKHIPKEFHPLKIRRDLRGSPKLVDWLKKELKVETSDIIVLGCKNEDVYQAANSKLLLLRADYAEENNPGAIIYKNQYGIPIAGAKNLQNFFETFKQFGGSWYYTLKVSPKTTIYGLTNANTINRTTKEVELNESFKACLKDGDKSLRIPFLIYFLVSTYAIVKEFETVDYWGIYPSSGVGGNQDLEYFKDKARESYKGVSKEPLLIRTTKVGKRHEMGRSDRISDGCNKQLDTIRLNPFYENKLEGKTVCIIDDFSTYGTSCETARALLEKAGVAKLIFITLGKFGKEFYQYSYIINGDPFGKFTYKKAKPLTLNGKFNTAANLDFIKSLALLMQK